MWRSALRRLPLFDGRSRGGAAAEPLSGVAMPDQTRVTGRTNVQRAASIAPCLGRRPLCLCCISCYLGAPLCRIRFLSQEHRRSPADSILPARRSRVRSSALPLGTHHAALYNGSLTGRVHVRDRVLIRQSASSLGDAVSRFRYSEPVSSSSHLGLATTRSRLYRICVASELSPSAPMARLGVLNHRHGSIDPHSPYSVFGFLSACQRSLDVPPMHSSETCVGNGNPAKTDVALHARTSTTYLSIDQSVLLSHARARPLLVDAALGASWPLLVTWSTLTRSSPRQNWNF